MKNSKKSFLTQVIFILSLSVIASVIDASYITLVSPVQQKMLEADAQGIFWIDPLEMNIQASTVIFIDARTEEEFLEATIPNAIHLSQDNWEAGSG